MRPQWDNSETKYAPGDNRNMKSTCAVSFLALDRGSGPLPVGRLSEPSRARKRDISGRRSCLWCRICPKGSFRPGTASGPCRLADDDPLQPFGSAPSNVSFQGVSGQSQRSGCLDMSLRIPSKGK